ncbi:MAG: hypothetical protein QXS30_03225, partial [Thermoplasmatales archaeon]
MTGDSREKDRSAISTSGDEVQFVERYKVDEESEVTIKLDRSRNLYMYEINAKKLPDILEDIEILRYMFLSSLDSERNSGD